MPVSDPEGLVALAAAADASIRRALSRGRRLHSEARYYLEQVQADCRIFRWGHPLIVEWVATSEIDRTRPLLSGPLFTSERHPWPNEDGVWLEPIAQIDLAEVGRLGGCDRGTGLLQAWMHGFEGWLRIIPVADVRRGLLTPIPGNVLAGDVQDDFNYRIGEDADPQWAEYSFAITGTKAPVLYPPWSFEATIHNALAYSLPGYVKGALRALLDALPENWSESAGHYFGNFDEVQFSTRDMPPTLLELGEMFSWGDGGSGQLFYELTEQGPRFSLQWSTP